MREFGKFVVNYNKLKSGDLSQQINENTMDLRYSYKTNSSYYSVYYNATRRDNKKIKDKI